MVERLLPFLVAAMALLYGSGVTRLWARAGAGRVISRLQVWAFAAAFAVLLAAVTGPMDGLADRSLPAHMAQHLLLLGVVGPLIAVSAPLTAALHALPDRMRRRAVPAWRGLLASQANRHWLAWTVAALGVSIVVLATWHLPAPYDLALRHDSVHVVEHVSFVAASAFLWWMALGAGRRSRRGQGFLVVFVSSLPATALGVLMVVSRTSWYRWYGTGSHALREQQVAGAVMWAFGSVVLVVGAAALFAGWLLAMDRAQARAEATTRPREVQGSW